MRNRENYEWYVYIPVDEELNPYSIAYTPSAQLMDMYKWELTEAIAMDGNVVFESDISEEELFKKYNITKHNGIVLLVSNDDKVSYAMTEELWDMLSEELGDNLEDFIIRINADFVGLLYILREFTHYLDDNYDVIQIMLNSIMKAVDDYEYVDFVRYVDEAWGLGGYYERRKDPVSFTIL